MLFKALTHGTLHSFFSKDRQSNSEEKEEPLALKFSEKMHMSPKKAGHTFGATVTVTPRSDSSADVSYDNDW